MFLATNCRAELVKKSPGPFFTDTGREVGKRWQALSDKQKTPRETKPSDDKARHEKAMKTRGVTHTASSKYHDEIISLVFIHTKYGEPIVIMVFRRAIQKVLCLSPPRQVRLALTSFFARRGCW